MHTLVLSISCSVAVSVLLKVARSRHIEIIQAIAVNYVIATALCVVLFQPSPVSLLTPSTPWWVLILLGVLLPTIFLAMASAVRYAGIVLSDAAQRLSLFIPLIASFLIFGETLSLNKAAGVILALIALLLLLIQRGNDAAGNAINAGNSSSPNARSGEPPVARSGRSSRKAVSYLICVWIGYGVIDILFKQMARSGAAFANSLLVTFVLAGIIIFAWLFARRTHWHIPSLKAGIILGLLNFGNIYFYVSAHQHFPENPTLVFTAMNIGVISLGTLVGAGFFRERLSAFNIAGITLAIAAIILLIPR